MFSHMINRKKLSFGGVKSFATVNDGRNESLLRINDRWALWMLNKYKCAFSSEVIKASNAFWRR